MTTDAPTFRSVFEELTGPGLANATARRAFGSILDGAWTPVQIAGFLVALRCRGESPSVIAEAARAMRDAMVRVSHDLPVVLDTCGTGGDGAGSLNLSTGAAIVCAGAGVPVAKHGNRAVSSRCGSADVLEALGVPIDLPASAAAPLLTEVGIAFLMAPVHHPAMKHAVGPRRELGIRTIFNCLGPLANPAGATHQLIGAYDDELRSVLAETLRELGSTRAWVVRSEDGLDEISPFAPTRVTALDGGSITERTVTPEDFGFRPSPPGAVAGGDAASNARALEAIVSGEEHPATDAVLLNAAAALTVARDIEPAEAAEQARAAVASGAARETLDRWRSGAQHASRR